MTSVRQRTILSAFALLWLAIFHYESLRGFYLNRWLRAELPKIRLLYPPAGWIMFYRVDESDGRAEVYGWRGGKAELIDPHLVFATRWLGYDNVRRNILISAVHPRNSRRFCSYLARKFPEYQAFSVVEAWIPSVLEKPQRTLRQVAYQCPP